MGERKVLNKYIPPDFDSSKIPRGTRKGGKRNEMKVRMMLPMSICCNTCGNYIMKGTKFNSRKEDALGEDYLGIQIFRFYFKCSACSAEFTIKTDPQNMDYAVEHGAKRNFEMYKEVEAQKKAIQKKGKFAFKPKSAGGTAQASREMTREVNLKNELEAAPADAGTWLIFANESNAEPLTALLVTAASVRLVTRELERGNASACPAAYFVFARSPRSSSSTSSMLATMQPL